MFLMFLKKLLKDLKIIRKLMKMKQFGFNVPLPLQTTLTETLSV
jgi:hypothetical protein